MSEYSGGILPSPLPLHVSPPLESKISIPPITLSRREDKKYVMHIAIIGASVIQDGDESLSIILTHTADTVRSQKSENIVLVSGGAGGCDHIAILLYLYKEKYNLPNVKGCLLFIPCEFRDGKYVENETRSWRRNPGWLANKRHRDFSRLLYNDEGKTLLEVGNASIKKVVPPGGGGFHERNTAIVMSSDLIIAYGRGDMKGGTADTWKKASERADIIRIYHNITKKLG